jgi:hypothetical protein
MKNLKPGLFLFVIITLASCAKADIATPAPTQEAINVFYPPTMQFWADSLANCASNDPHIALYFFPLFTPSEVGGKDILLGLGQATQDDGDAFLSQVGWDQLVIVVNASNKTSHLSQEEIEQIFSGKVTEWMGGQKLPVKVWVFPSDDPNTKVFNKVLMGDLSLTSEAHLAPDAKAMIEAVSQNPGAIGFLPESILKSSETSLVEALKIISLPAAFNTEFHQPVIAITQTEPKGFLRQLLICLQNSGE